MRYVSIEDTRPGMCLAYDLFDIQGRIVISSGAVLTENIIRHLDDFGFSGVYIDDELSRDLEIIPVIEPELRAAGMTCIKEQNIDKCIEIAKQIVDQIIDKSPVSINMLDIRSYDDYTYAHSVHVAVLCCAVGLSMKLSELDLENLVIAALLHDIGKLYIDPKILYKKERLTPEEYQIMKGHAVMSYEMIQDRQDLAACVKQAVLGHHENVDGSGYPQGLTKDEQSLFMRIIHVVDVYDALTTRRPYKKPYSPCEGIEYLMGACGTWFDIEVVCHFMASVPLFPKGTEVLLSDGRSGYVVDNSGEHNLRPVIRLFTGKNLDLSLREHMNTTIVAFEEDGTDSPVKYERGRRKMIEIKRKPMILIVDDEKKNRQILTEILIQRYDVKAVGTVQEAVEFLNGHSIPELVIMDMDLAEGGGIAAAKTIQEMFEEHLDVLYVLERCDVAMSKLCTENEAAGYLVRPYRAVYIKSEVERIINGWSDFC